MGAPTDDKREVYGPTHRDIRGVLEASDVHEAPSIDLRAAAGAETDDSETYEITAAEQRQRADMQMRHALTAAIDSEIGGGQDKYDVFGWDEDPEVEDYYGMYLRNAYARAVCDQPVDTTWRDAPQIEDRGETADDEQTEFEQEVEHLVEDLRLWHYTHRADKLSGIGEFGILVLEFDDIDSPEGFADEVDENSVSELNGLRPFSQASVDEIELGGPGSGRWGEPNVYHVDLDDEDDAVSHNGPTELEIHHSRVVHIPSDGLLDDEIRGTPRQEPIWNNLVDIEKALGSAGEVAYRASAWGINVNISPDYQLEDGGDNLRDHLQRWYYGLEPILRTEGADDVQNLGGETIDPQPIIDPNVAAISAQVGIPQSVLKGNETGERATQQDLREWYGKIQSRREEFVTPTFVREIIDRCLRYGVLIAPAGQAENREIGGYDVSWPPLAETDESEVASIKKTRAEFLNTATAGYPDDLLTREQQLEFYREGTLPTELDDEIANSAESNIDESDADVQQAAEEMGIGTGAESNGADANGAPADDD
ncbi:anti-CBASS protein Acb1 family protein [Haloterrigena salifodinae]|uniref:anti-CBASS protein Acb1 family protein n=1 Tax=Haloterrigena salifodinae TaxID=2675099 RepID=UPI000F8832D0|nr:anti-CBASS Acb1 family protein [Haloterrigena salifodinae]